MDTFPKALEAFGIKHLSVSHVKTWDGNRASWYLKYILKLRSSPVPAMFRGSAVEHGLAVAVASGDDDKGGVAMLEEYERLLRDAELSPTSDDAGKERNNLERYYEHTLLCAAECGLSAETNVTVQQPVERTLDGILSIGYCDFDAPARPYELKTVGRMPSVPKVWDVQQVLMYMAALEKDEGVLMYATVAPARNKSHPGYRHYVIRNDSNELASMGVPSNLGWYDSHAMGICGFLDTYLKAVDGDVERAKEDMKWACAPDLESFMWKRDDDRMLADKVWST